VPFLVEIGQKLAKQMPKDAPAEVVEWDRCPAV
jgi:hypothetical protein